MAESTETEPIGPRTAAEKVAEIFSDTDPSAIAEIEAVIREHTGFDAMRDVIEGAAALRGFSKLGDRAASVVDRIEV